MKLTILGYLGGYPYKGKGTSSYLLESDGFSLLIDAGSSTLNILQKHLNPLKLDSVILSHYHEDHVADLGVLQYYRQLRGKGKNVPVLPIYGHTEDLESYHRLTLEGISISMPYEERKPLDIGPFSIQFLRTVHPVPCFAMRIKEKQTGKNLVYTGDSGYLEALIPFAFQTDVLLADTYLFAGKEKHLAHLTAKETGEIAQLAQVKQVILSHLPQDGDLQVLKKQTEKEVTNIPVRLASESMMVEW